MATKHESVDASYQKRLNSGHVPKQSNNKKGRKGHSEYHCLDDVCILVRLPSSSTFASTISDIGPDGFVSDESLEAYAKKADYLSDQSTEESYEESEDNSYDDEYYFEETNKDDGEKHEDKTLQCIEFLDTVAFAKEMIKEVLVESEAKIESLRPSLEESQDNPMENFKGSMDLDYVFIEKEKSFTGWPTIDSFTIETGAYKIDEYLASFDTEEDWMYVIYFHGIQQSHFSDLYKYQAIYSLPTWKYPIAQATASVFFTIEVCKAKPPYCSVDVTYKYESFRHICKPGIEDFQEKWLHYILDTKINLFKTVTY